MSRRSTTGYGHAIQYIAYDHFRLSWVSDRHYASSRLRFPTSFRRDTDARGARRFAKKWECALPKEAEDKRNVD